MNNNVLAFVKCFERCCGVFCAGDLGDKLSHVSSCINCCATTTILVIKTTYRNRFSTENNEGVSTLCQEIHVAFCQDFFSFILLCEEDWNTDWIDGAFNHDFFFLASWNDDWCQQEFLAYTIMMEWIKAKKKNYLWMICVCGRNCWKMSVLINIIILQKLTRTLLQLLAYCDVRRFGMGNSPSKVLLPMWSEWCQSMERMIEPKGSWNVSAMHTRKFCTNHLLLLVTFSDRKI